MSGTNIFVYLNDKLGRLQSAFYDGKQEANIHDEDMNGEVKKKQKINIGSHKYNIKNEKDNFRFNLTKNFWDEIVNRNRLFYCAHMNRKNAFFQKHILNSKEQPEEIASKIFQNIFGFNRLRKQVKDNVMEILRQLVNN